MQVQAIAHNCGDVNSDTQHLDKKNDVSTDSAEIHDFQEAAKKRMARLKQQWLDLVWASDASDGAKVVARAIVGFLNHAGVAWPAETTIAAKCGHSHRSVQRAIAELRARKFIVTSKAWFKGPLEYRLLGIEELDRGAAAWAKAKEARKAAKSGTPKPPTVAAQPSKGSPKKEYIYGKEDSRVESQSSIIPFNKYLSEKKELEVSVYAREGFSDSSTIAPPHGLEWPDGNIRWHYSDEVQERMFGLEVGRWLGIDHSAGTAILANLNPEIVSGMIRLARKRKLSRKDLAVALTKQGCERFRRGNPTFPPVNAT